MARGIKQNKSITGVEHLMLSKKYKWFALGLMGAGLMTSCATESLYEKEFLNYTDTFSSVLISTDQNTLAVLSSRYHYVFKTSQKLVAVLTSSAHKNISAHIREFTLGKANAISGEVELCLPASANADDIKSLTAKGFRKYSETSDKYCEEFNLDGVRYAAGKVMVSQVYQLNQTYDVNVRVKENVWEKGVKIALTPITVAADGVVVIAAVPFIAFYMIALANSPGAFAH
jgi:hypothetical protein